MRHDCHDCDATREGFPDLLSGEAEGGARLALLEEVARCEDCAREYRTMAETLRAFDHAAAATLPAEDFWPGYGERLRMRIEQEIQPNFWGRRADFMGEYRLTFVEDEGLLRRLARELTAVAREGAAGTNEGRGGGSKPKYEAAHGGGGGGRQEQTPASQGKLPTAQLEVPPILTANPHPPTVAQPHLPTPVTIQVDPMLVKADPRDIPYGDPRSTATIPSSGTGRGGGMGDGTGGGVGTGDGTGYGAGRGYNTGGGDAHEGGGGPGGGGGGGVDYNRPFKTSEVTRKAVITSKPEPGFTEEARKNNVTGVVRLRAILSAGESELKPRRRPARTRTAAFKFSRPPAAFCLLTPDS